MRNALAAVTLLLSTAGVAAAQTSYPMLMSLHPVAAQVGATSEHTLSSRYTMHGATAVLVTGDGVKGEIVTEMKPVKPGEARPNLTKIKIRFHVDANAKPGVRDFRLVTPHGVSTLGQLVVGRDPVVVEEKKNNAPEQAQRIELPATICGAVERSEDVDYFRFEAKAGRRYTFHVRSMRLQDRIHDLQQHVDPIIALKNEAGSTLAVSDNHYAADPLLHYRFPEDGEYFLEVRDVRYQGNAFWEYCIEASDRPFLTAVHPLGVKRGEKTSLQLIGLGLPESPQPAATFTPGTSHPDGPQTVQLDLPDGGRSNPVAVVVSDLPQTVEAAGDNDSPQTAQPAVVPGGINGRIESPGDVDCFVFEAKKGESLRFEVLARRWDSPLDSHLRILEAKSGRQLVLNDDFTANRRSTPDSLIESWTTPADGKYVVEIRDMNQSGGDDFVYHLQVEPAEPTFELYLDTDKTQLFPGTHAVVFARAFRKNGFDGDIQLAVDGLPEGVTASCGRILPGGTKDGCIVLSAAADAKPAFANIVVTGTATASVNGEAKRLEVDAVPQQEIYMPGGGRNHWHVDVHTVAVGEPCDVRSVTLGTNDVTLKPGESKRIDVTIERSPGYDKNVTLDMLFRHLNSTYADTLPPGVTIDARNSKTLLTGKEVKGHITLKAAPNAKPVDKQQVAVMANISINFVMKATYASKPLFVTVQKP